ncbi:type II toxin-antitoxin system VapC family toxin [bacterium AH-315-J04]|nr:type II toxin-antitoxin system VapC family toxin [bacterium AH-315-J04]
MSAHHHIVAVDTNILVWGIRLEGDEDKVKRAKWLFQDFDDSNAQVVIPSIALAEYLVPYDSHVHSDVVGPLAKRFIIAPFDVKCASLGARLFKEGLKRRKIGTPYDRKIIKSDALVVATAYVHGARTFYSDDARCRKLAAQTNMTVKSLPTIAPDLFSQ